jgi:hypothetical protein
MNKPRNTQNQTKKVSKPNSTNMETQRIQNAYVANDKKELLSKLDALSTGSEPSIPLLASTLIRHLKRFSSKWSTFASLLKKNVPLAEKNAETD